MPTILHRLARWADSDPHSVAQRYKRNGVWESITAAEYCDRMYYLALFFESRGMTQQDIGTVLAPNSYHWVHCDLAYLLLGAKSAGLYPNSTSKDIAYILNHTESRFLAVKDKEFFQKSDDPFYNSDCFSLGGVCTGIESKLNFNRNVQART